jgi:hypothetical protein
VGEHHWHSSGTSTSTAMIRNNTVHEYGYCCHCLTTGIRVVKEEDAPIPEGCGRYYSAQRRVVNSIEWTNLECNRG